MSSHEPLIAEMYGQDRSLAEKKANALLMAKAPELLDTLRLIVREAGYCLEQTATLRALGDRARALLAEIEGTEP